MHVPIIPFGRSLLRFGFLFTCGYIPTSTNVLDRV